MYVRFTCCTAVILLRRCDHVTITHEVEQQLHSAVTGQQESVVRPGNARRYYNGTVTAELQETSNVMVLLHCTLPDWEQVQEGTTMCYTLVQWTGRVILCICALAGNGHATTTQLGDWSVGTIQVTHTVGLQHQMIVLGPADQQQLNQTTKMHISL